MVTTKHCCFGVCRSDSRYGHRDHMKGVFFIAFPKPRKDPEKCQRWVRACEREGFTAENVTKDTYICSLHFVGGKGPTIENPDPIPATATSAQNQGSRVSDVTKRRRTAWVSAIRRTEVQFDNIPRSFKVCSRHFHTGKPAYEMDEAHPDWAPSLHLGYSEVPATSGDNQSTSIPTPQRKSIAERRATNTSCCVVGCTNRFDKNNKTRKFYRIPSTRMHFKRRVWLQAIRGSDWSKHMIKNATICSDHFISGEASDDYDSPDFVPSIFPFSTQSDNAKFERYKRKRLRAESPRRCADNGHQSTPTSNSPNDCGIDPGIDLCTDNINRTVRKAAKLDHDYAASPPADVFQLSVVEEEIQPEQQEWSPSLDQEDPEPPFINEKREELQLNHQTDIMKFRFSPVHVKSEDDEGSEAHQLSVKKEAPPEQEVWSPSLGHMDLEPPHIKEEQEELQVKYETDIMKFRFSPVHVKSKDDEGSDAHQLSVVKKEASPEQQVWSPSLGHMDLEPPHIKEEQEELQVKYETDIIKFRFSPVHVKSEDDEGSDTHQLSVVKKETPPDQQVWSSSLNQEDPEPSLMKEEQEELELNHQTDEIKLRFSPVHVKSEDDGSSDAHQLPDVKKEAPPEQQVWSPSLDHMDSEPPHIKEEQDELWTSQELQDLMQQRPSSDEWLPSGSTGSSRASSPDAPGRKDHGYVGGCESSKGCGQDPGWYQSNWQPNQIPFTATPGPRNAAAELDSNQPADFLELFLTDELLQLIVDQTNLYAHQYFQTNSESLPHSRANAWKPVSVPELKTFFGLSFMTGYVKKPNLELYWSVDEVDATPYFPRTMSRNRFQIIWRFLHYNYNGKQDTSDKMYKVRPVLDYIVEKFKELYQPGKNICINEGMMQWRGHLSFRVYNPQKPVKYGIKSYVLCDSATGYCFNLEPYVGEASSLSEIVFSLLDRLPGHGYTVYMDNVSTSVGLCERLLGAQTNVCGTLRKNRGEPKIIREIKKSDLGAREKVVRHNERVMVVAWQDKQLVKMVTTCHQDKMQGVDVQQRGHKNKVSQFKPECVVAYNSSMNGVVKLDRNIAYYPFIRRSLNWSKKFVAYLFQVSMFNAYVLYRARNPGESKTLLEFMRRVVKTWTAKQYVGKEEEEEAAGVGHEGDDDFEEGERTPRAPYNTDPHSRLDGQMAKHKLERLMPTSKKSRPARRCRVCTRRGRRSETKMWCMSCCVPLHAGECFTAYHTKLNYCK